MRDPATQSIGAEYVRRVVADATALEARVKLVERRPYFLRAAGSPNGVVTAPVGSLYTRTDGGANTTLYVKESGTGSAGWVAK